MRSARVFVIGGILLTLTAAGSTTAKAASQARNGLVAFSAQLPSGIQILTVQPNGRGLRQLTHLQNLDINGPDPAWSPDGRKIIFARELDRQGSNSELYLMNANGSHIRRLTTHPGEDEDPAWSPDGHRIAFARRTSTTGIGLAVMNADGSHVRILVSDGLDSSPTWSPNGAQIAFIRHGGPGRLWLVNANGTNPHPLIATDQDDEADPAWSPSGSRIIFLRHNPCGGNCDVPSLLTVKPDGTAEQAVVDASGFQQPTWSPDGTMLAAIGELHGGQEGDLTIMRADGTVIRTIRPVTSQILDIAWQPLPPTR